MLTDSMRELAGILATAGARARRAWVDRNFSVGQTAETRPGETMDFFTDVDQKLDRFVMDEMREKFGITRFLTEEGAKDPERNATGGLRAVNDIIDGTSNFMTGEVDFSLSACIEAYGVVNLAGIMTPARGELLVAARGEGTWFLNCYGQKLADIEGMLSSDHFMKKVMVDEFELPQTKKRPSPLETARIYWHTGKRRNFELAPLEGWNTFPGRLANPGCTFCCTAALVKVALGKLDGAAIGFQNYWDFAAGRRLIEEAGGHFTALSRDYSRTLTEEDFARANATKTADGDEWLCHIFAAGKKELLEAITQHFTLSYR